MTTVAGQRVGWALYLSRQPIPGASFGAQPAAVTDALASPAQVKDAPAP